MNASYRLTLQYTIVSLLATASDFSFFIFWGFMVKSADSIATFFSMLVGAIVSWTLHRTWVFSASEVGRKKKMGRYFSGVVLSILLNVVLVALLADFLQLPRIVSRVAASITVWAAIYWFNRKVVFKI